MNMHTSTPLIVPKQNTNVLSHSIFENTSSVKNNMANNINWDSFGACFTDFNGGLSDTHDSFFDGHKSHLPAPLNKIQFRLPITSDSSDLINGLKNCSISKIHDSNIENVTVKSSSINDNNEKTLIANLSSEIIPINIASNDKITAERRQSTTVRPFSFEIREKEKQERKHDKLQYKIVNEQLNANGFQAMPVFKASPKLHKKVVIKNVKKKVIKCKSAALHQVNDVKDVYDINLPSQCNFASQSNNKNVKIDEVHNEMDVNDDVQQNIDNGVKKNDVKINNNQKYHKIEPWKKKPFQISLPKRKLTKPESPKLITAQRAYIRKSRDDKTIEREQRELAAENMIIVAKRQRVNEKIFKLRNQRIQMRDNNPLSMSKRPLTDPTMPIYPKRPRNN